MHQLVGGDPFESPKALLAWSGDDLTTIERSIRAFFDHNPWTRIEEKDRVVRGAMLHKARLKQPLPVTLRRDIQRVTDEMKKAIDQALYSAICMVDREPRGDVWFPWAKNPEDLEKRLTNPSIPESLHDAIRAIEPYPQGQGYSGGDKLLRTFARISGPSRHRVSLTIGATAASYRLQVRSMTKASPVMDWNCRKCELTMIRLLPGGSADYECDVELFAAIDHPELRHIPVGAFLRHAHARISYAVQTLENAAIAKAAR